MFRRFLLFVITALLTTTMFASVKVEKTEYKGWPNCYRVSNGEIELIVTGDVGPRVIRFGFVGGQNLFKEYPEQLGHTGEAKFQLRGGDRVWKAPEDPVATWAPDNVPVEIHVTANGLIARNLAIFVHLYIGSDERPQEPGPHGALVIRTVAFNLTSRVSAAILRIALSQRA